MNSIHDMGGMHGLGELDYQESEPVFHEPWEGRVLAMMNALGLFRGLRTGIEGIPAIDYLQMSYWERWLTSLTKSLVKYELATTDEIESGRAEKGTAKSIPSLTPAEARELPFKDRRTELEVNVTPQFKVGQRVQGRNMHPTTHTRMPRYTRGKIGTVERDRGVFALPDNEAYNLDPRPQHVYLIRFEARELWGEAAPEHDKLYIDMWEDYIEPV